MKPIYIPENLDLANCEIMIQVGSGRVASIFNRNGIIRTFTGDDAQVKASGYGMAYLEGRLSYNGYSDRKCVKELS